MSHSQEPSYYEIALTNRQVLVVFVVLLVCIVVAFFSGVWVGRQNGPIGTIAKAEATAGDGEARPGSGPGPEKLNFFSADRERAEATPSLAEVAEEPQGDSTLLEDLSGDRAEQETTGEPSAQEAATGARAASPPTAGPAIGAPAESSASGGHVIQVFSSTDEQQAERLHKQLVGGGFPAFLSPVDVSGQTMYRVRIGPYAELSEAETVAERVRSAFKLDTWVTR